MRSIYRKVARENGVTLQEVRREINTAIQTAYAGQNNEIIRCYQCQIPKKASVPTDEEVVRFLAQKTYRRFK